jgi:MinD-like ATPase involved in chromosome partitioning or flagellar assembly/tetratricopeptide (TPR) repeat protein
MKAIGRDGQKDRKGRVVTFYSYKGGTGRSMALSNVAWILASAGKRVLMIDWDLEAPGLHRYFRPFLIDHELNASDGLMDLVDRYASEAIRPPPPGQSLPEDWWLPLADISEHVLGINFAGFPAGGAIDLLPAGRQCDTYAVKVSAFNWQNFFDRLGGGGFLDAVRERARSEYDYVLIDSRTGVSDTAGICTAQMPDTLVVCFTYNNQSVKGAAAVAASARRLHAELAEQRLRSAAAPVPGATLSDSPLPYRVLPVPMRVDAGESERLALREAFARAAFAPLLGSRSDAHAAAYWTAVEVPHRVFYAYEEVLAPFKDDARDPKTVLAAFVRLTKEVSDSEVSEYSLPIEPELRQRLLEAYAETPQTAASRQASAVAARESEDEALTRSIETALRGLSEEELVHARSVLGRLVRLGRDDEGGGVFPIRVAMSEIDSGQRSIVATLVQRAILALSTEVRPGPSGAAAAEQVLALASERLIVLSPTWQRWLNEDREFLLWRQQLRAYRSDWLRSGERSALLSGSPLAEARLWSRRRAADLNEAERGYIEASIEAADAMTQTLPPQALRPDPSPARMPAPETPVWAQGPEATAWRPAPADAASAPALPLPTAARGGGPRFAVIGLVALAGLGSLAYWALKPGAFTGPRIDPAASAASPTPPPAVALTLAQELAQADKLNEQGQLAEAEAAYRRVLARAPDNVQALLQLGRIADRNGDYAAAAAHYQRAIELDPTRAQPRIERAASLIAQRRFDAALEDLNQALVIEPNNALAHLNRGVVRENLGRGKEAIVDYNAAIRHNQSLVPAYLRRAALLEKSDPAAARADYQSVLGLPATDTATQVARERLTALGQKPAKPALAANEQRVYIQYSDAADQRAVQALHKALVSALAPVNVPAYQKVSVRSEGEVRYFFAEDRELAQRTADAAEAELAKSGSARVLKPTFRDAQAFPSAVRGTVEIWLPSLSFVAPTRGVNPPGGKK